MRSSKRSIADLILHLHPRSAPRETLRFTLSFGLGGMAVVLACLLFSTGVLLLLVYRPTVEGAYESIVVLDREVPFGPWVRNIHHLSANLLVGAALLHLLRAAFTGAFGPGRRLNWVIGLALFVLVLAANFTGYLLPWDQLAYWAVTICTGMLAYAPLAGQWLQEVFRGGREIGQPTLSNFFVLHVAVIPACLLGFMAWHFWLVRTAGGLVRARKAAPATRVPTVPHLVVREAAVGLCLVAFVFLLAMFTRAPLMDQANPGMSPNPTKAPWYFQGFQELLLHLHPAFAACVWPFLGVAALAGAPFLPGASLPPGVWFGSGRGRRLALWAALAGAGAATGAVLLDSLPALAGSGAGAISWLARGLAPTLALGGLAAGSYLLLVRRAGFSRAEAVMAGLAFGLAAMAAFTVVGVWFRGEEMRLVWPWTTPAQSVERP